MGSVEVLRFEVLKLSETRTPAVLWLHKIIVIC
jgi:hypothetical protein